MGKSGKLFKTLLVGVKAFKSPSKDERAAKPSPKEEKAQLRKGNKEKCLWSLGKSSSRNRDSQSRSPSTPFDMTETNTAQAEDQEFKIVQPVIPIVVTAPVHVSNTPAAPSDALIIVGDCCAKVVPRKGLTAGWDEATREDWAAAKIQATVRCYLAQRAFRALKAVVKLQALARGRMVRKQAASTLKCIQALVRVQAHIRARRVRTSELGQLVQRHLQQAKQQRRKSTEKWISSTSSVQELQAKALSKQEAAMKRQRALVYAFSEQLHRCAPKKSSLVIDCQPDKGHWGWLWLERWTAARSWEHSSSAVKEQPAKNDERVNANINAENYKTIKKEIFPGSEVLTEQIKEGKHMNVLKSEGVPFNDASQMTISMSETVPCSDVLGVTKSKTHIKGETQEVALNTEIVSDSVAAMVNTEANSTPPPPPLPPFRRAACPSQPDSLSSLPLLSSYQTVIPCVTQPVMPCRVPSTDSDSTNALTPSPPPPVAMAISSPSTLTAPLSTVAQLPEVSVTPDTLHIQTVSQAELSLLNQDLSMSTSVVESGSPPLPVSSVTTASAEQRSPKWQHIIPDPLKIPDHMLEEISNGALAPEENVHRKTDGSDAAVNGAVGSANEERDSTDGELQTLKNGNGKVKLGTDSERIGNNSSSVIPSNVNITEASSKRNDFTGTKNEQGECVSPSLPNYMANTLSSKAKARSHSSPKQSDSVSPSSRRRHSLSGSEGKNSPVIHRHISHVRAGSKGQSTSLRDGSGDNSPSANGESRRHVK